MRLLASESPVADRVRAFVRERVRRDGAHYLRGTGTQLAAHLGKPTSWVSEYADPEPTHPRHADLDTALAICDFFTVDIGNFRKADHVPSNDKGINDLIAAVKRHGLANLLAEAPSRNEKRAIKLLGMMNEDGLAAAVGVLAEMAKAFPRAQQPESRARAARTRGAKGNIARETR